MKRGNGPTMAERVGSSTAQKPQTELERQRGPQEVHGHHCWVMDPVDHAISRPGLAVDWRTRSDGGQDVYVVYMADLARGWTQVREWLPAVLVEVPLAREDVVSDAR